MSNIMNDPDFLNAAGLVPQSSTSTSTSTSTSKARVYDVWYSDGNDRSVIGTIVTVSDLPDNDDAWDALDKAIATYSNTDTEWEFPYMEPSAICITTDCECEDYCECPTESLTIEPCPYEGMGHTYQHADVDTEELSF